MVRINYVESNNQFKFINQNENIIIKSVPESNILYSPQNGGNIYFDKILFSSIKLLISFQNYLIVKYRSIILIDFINKYYNEFKLIEDKNIIATYSYSKNKKHILLASKYITNKIDEHFINEKIYSFGYFDSLQLLYDDSLKFNKNISICEISILPSCFEVLKNFNVDVFYNNSNYLNYSIKSWKELINNYKLYMPNNVNFIYNESKYLIKNNYDILIINLIKNLDFDYNKQNIKNEPNEYTKYSVNTILKYVKKQLKYLNYVKIGGSCYFKIHNLWSNDTINIYYKICTLFKNVEFFMPKYKLMYKKLYGGIWLKCYNKLKTPKKINKIQLFQKVEEFNFSVYDKMIEYFYNLDRFIDKKLINDNLKLKMEVFNMQLDTAINFCNEYNLEISPKWKQLIKEKIYIQNFIVN